MSMSEFGNMSKLLAPPNMSNKLAPDMSNKLAPPRQFDTPTRNHPTKPPEQTPTSAFSRPRSGQPGLSGSSKKKRRVDGAVHTLKSIKIKQESDLPDHIPSSSPTRRLNMNKHFSSSSSRGTNASSSSSRRLNMNNHFSSSSSHGTNASSSSSSHGTNDSPQKIKQESDLPDHIPVSKNPDVSWADACKMLDDDQLAVLAAALAGHNLLIVGGPGAGKSLLVNVIHAMTRLPRTATTHAACTVLNASAPKELLNHMLDCVRTFYAHLGVGLLKESTKVIIRNIRARTDVLKRWTAPEAGLIIDECSMLNSQILEKLHRIACILRNSNDVMGGMQIILVGDFGQLPPFTERNTAIQFLFNSRFMACNNNKNN